MQQDAVLEFLRGNDLKLSGDGRCDSPGYSAKYCTYSLMDSATDLILDYKLIQSSETGSSVGGIEAVSKLFVRAGCLSIPLLQIDIGVWVH